MSGSIRPPVRAARRPVCKRRVRAGQSLSRASTATMAVDTAADPPTQEDRCTSPEKPRSRPAASGSGRPISNPNRAAESNSSGQAQIEKIDDRHYKVTVSAPSAMMPMNVVLDLELTEVDEPNRIAATIEGALMGGPINGTGSIELAELGPKLTRATWVADATLGGMLGGFDVDDPGADPAGRRPGLRLAQGAPGGRGGRRRKPPRRPGVRRPSELSAACTCRSGWSGRGSGSSAARSGPRPRTGCPLRLSRPDSAQSVKR